MMINMICILTSVHVYCMTVFFFFKQKTAYEMRISDWSSDVCSSDLLFGDEGDPGAVLHIKIERVRTPIEELDPDLIDSDRFDQFTDIHAGSPVGAEIGRASCRERVCQYV